MTHEQKKRGGDSSLLLPALRQHLDEATFHEPRWELKKETCKSYKKNPNSITSEDYSARSITIQWNKSRDGPLSRLLNAL